VDETDAVIPGATVTATNLGTDVVVAALTNDGGNYRINFLIPGRYEITASLPGFKTTRQEVELRVGDRMTVDLVLQIGEISEQVTVEGTTLLETTNANLGQVIDNRRITDIGSIQGNPTLLLKIAPGAVAAHWYANLYEEPGYSISGLYTFHGSPRFTANFTLNGVPNNQNRGAANAQPPQEAVQEFKISSSYDATHGHSSGTNVDVILKSGTNDFHGSVYGFFRETGLNANTFMDNRAGNERPDLDYKRYGFAVNGPVLFPGLYNGREKTFFSYSHEVVQVSYLELSGVLTIPTPEQKEGDFSKLLELGPAYQIYDPLTTRASTSRVGFYERDPFPGNIIPQNRIHPASRMLMGFYPDPNLPGGADGSRNFQGNTASPTSWYHNFTRIDHHFTDKHRLFGHYGFLDQFGKWADDFQTLATGVREKFRRHSLGLDDVYSVTPNLLLNFRYGFTRLGHFLWHKSVDKYARQFENSEGFDITNMGWPESFVNQLNLELTGLPHIWISGQPRGSGIATRAGNYTRAFNSHSTVAQTDYIKGNHILKTGFEFRELQVARFSWLRSMPRIEFGTGFTRGPFSDSASAPITGFASFLMGIPDGGFVFRPADYIAHSTYYGVFLQDNWRATSNLTLNFGIRYEGYGAPAERFDRTVRQFDFNSASPIEAHAAAAYARHPIPELAANQFVARGGLTFAGTGGNQRGWYEPQRNLWNPRIGFAYRFGPESVLRGGYGLFSLPMGLAGDGVGAPFQHGFSRATELVPSLDGGVSFVADLSNPFPSGILEPLGAEGRLATDLGKSVSFFNPRLKAPYFQRWSLKIQHMLPQSTLLEVGYVGSRATRLRTSYDRNFLPQRFLSTQSTRDNDNIAFLSQRFSNPFLGLIPGTSLGENTLISREQLFKPFPHFLRVSDQTNQGYSWYHALESRFERRFSKGYTLQGAYTWSKNMQATEYLNPGDLFPHEVIAGTDRTHVLSFSGIWELPFGPGKPFGSAVSPGLARLIGGWELTSMWQLTSGMPLNWPDLFFDGNIKNISLSGSQQTVERWFNTGAGFSRSPANQPRFHLRTWPLRLNSVRMDSLNMWDITLIKNTRIGEAASVQFRAEFLNAFNHPTFALVNMSPQSGSFGSVNNESVWARQIQLGLKFLF
jgi:hypothetical protein